MRQLATRPCRPNCFVPSTCALSVSSCVPRSPPKSAAWDCRSSKCPFPTDHAPLRKARKSVGATPGPPSGPSSNGGSCRCRERCTFPQLAEPIPAIRWACRSSRPRFASHKRRDAGTETILPVATHPPHSKTDFPQHLGNLRPGIKLLNVGFFLAPIRVPNLAERDNAANQLLLGNILAIFHQAGPVLPFREALTESLASSRFCHVENQQPIGRQSIEHSLAHLPQRPQGVIRIKEV